MAVGASTQPLYVYPVGAVTVTEHEALMVQVRVVGGVVYVPAAQPVPATMKVAPATSEFSVTWVVVAEPVVRCAVYVVAAAGAVKTRRRAGPHLHHRRRRHLDWTLGRAPGEPRRSALGLGNELAQRALVFPALAAGSGRSTHG